MFLKKLTYDSFYSVCALGSKIALSFISIPICLTYLGKEKFGLWMLLLSIVSFIQFFDAGITPTLKNKLVESYTLDNNSSFKKYFQVGLLFSIILVVVTILFAAIIPMINWRGLFSISNNIHNAEILSLFYVVFFISSLTLVLSSIENYYAATQHLGRIKYFEFIFTILSIGVLYLAVKFKLSLVLIAFIYSGQVILVKFIFLFKLLNINFSLFYIEKKHFADLLQTLKKVAFISLPFWGIKLCEFVLTVLPNISIAKYIDIEGIAVFNVIYKYASIPMFVLLAVLPILWPVFTLKWVRQDYLWLRNAIQFGLGMILIGFTVFMVFSYFYGTTIISFWSRNNINISPYSIIAVIFLCFSMSSTYMVSTFLHSVSDFRFEFFCHLTIVFLSIGSIYFFMRIKQVDIAILGIGLAWLTGGFIPMYFRTRSFLKR